MYEVIFSKNAIKSLKRIPKNYQIKISRIIYKLRTDPFSLDIKKLTNSSLATHRLRIGSYRLFLDIDTEQKIVGIAGLRRRTTQTYR